MSNDVPIGIPFNIASYGLLLNLFAKVLKLTPKYLTVTMAEPHIYHIGNHIEATREQVAEYEKNRVRYMGSNVQLLLPEKDNINDFKLEDIVLEGYNPNRNIKYSGIAI
jgi:thymidylate synthase